MTIKKLFGLGIFCAVLLCGLKIVFLGSLNIDNFFILLVWWLLITVIAVALIRRLGVINYLESFLVIGFWLIFSLIADAIFVTSLLGVRAYVDRRFWMGYVVMILAMLLFHKKRHVEVRKQLKTK